MEATELISIRGAAKLVGKTYMTISNNRASAPDADEAGRISWTQIDAMILLNKDSLINVAVENGWIVKESA